MIKMKRLLTGPFGKTPWAKNFFSVAYVGPTEEEIAKHMASQGNIAVVLGGPNRACIVDVDDMVLATPFVEKWRSTLEKCPRVQTPRGGRHFYGLIPPEYPFLPSMIKPLPGIDLLADLHFAMYPPSFIHNEEKGIHGAYKWITEPAEEMDLPVFPKAMIEEMVIAHEAKRSASKKKDWAPGENYRPSGDFSLLDGTEPVYEGERNSTMASIVGQLIVREGVNNADLLVPRLMEINNTRFEPPLSYHEVRSVARSMCATDRKNNPDRAPRPEVNEAEMAAVVEPRPAAPPPLDLGDDDDFSIPVPPPPAPAVDYGDDNDFGGAPAPKLNIPEPEEFLRPELRPIYGAPRPDGKNDEPNDCARWVLANVFGPGLILLGETILVRDSKRKVWREVAKEHLTNAIQGVLNTAKARTESIYYSLRNMIYYPQSDYPLWHSVRAVGRGPAGYPDDARDLIAFRNGLLGSRSMVLFPHTPHLVTMAQMPFDYDPTAVCPRWIQFLQEIWGSENADRAIALRQFFGYALTADISQHKILMLNGVSRSGKSTIGKVLHALVGKHNTEAVTLSALITPHGMSLLVGKLLAIFYDAHLPSYTTGAQVLEMLKSLGAGDPQHINQKYMRGYTAQLTVKLLLICNEIPRIEDADSALAARLIPLRCDRSFLGQEDFGLVDELYQELPGIANWALRGMQEYREAGKLFMPKEALEDLRALRRATNPIAAFLEDYCEIYEPRISTETIYETKVNDLFLAWNQWSNENNYRGIGTKMKFIDRIRGASANIKVVRRGTIDYVTGIKLLTSATASLSSF